MNIHLLSVGIDAISIALMLITAARFLSHAPGHKNTWLILAIILGAISYILSSRQDYEALIPTPFDADYGSLFPLMNVMRNSTTAFFMLLCHSIFRDGSPAPKILIFMLVVQVFLEEPLAWLLGAAWPAANPQLSVLLFEVTPTIIQLTFLGFALFWILSEREADLVVSRRRVRVFFLVIYIAQVILSLVVERVAMSFDIIPWTAQYPIHVALSSIGLMTSTAILFSLMSPENVDDVLYPNPSAPSEKDKPPTEPQPPDSTEQDVARIVTALESEQIYQTAGLSVGDLATHLSIPEYRLRLLIHQHMGFRNFNALLHYYRVEEVSTALADPAQNKTPVLTLALSAGYQSINPFNRAFREIKKMTPTQYRRHIQNTSADSSNSTPVSDAKGDFE